MVTTDHIILVNQMGFMALWWVDLWVRFMGLEMEIPLRFDLFKNGIGAFPIIIFM
jgi:hypothetical protein